MTDWAALVDVRYVLDTNVVSELMRAAPDDKVQAWYDNLGSSRLAVAAPTVVELRYGVEILKAGPRRDALSERTDAFMIAIFGPRIIDVSAVEARACASIMAKKRALGESLEDHVADAMIAACALTAGLAVATRNENEFRNTGVKVVNPWRAKR